jgi:hypothetical protein
MISSSLPDRDDCFEKLLSELVDAHVDTIELFVGGDDVTTCTAHVQYLQGLVRYSKRLMVDPLGQPRVR